MEQRRYFGRIPFGTQIHVEFDNRRLVVSLVDISLKGALFRCPPSLSFPENSVIRLTLPLSDEVVLEFGARVVHADSEVVGVKFTSLDADTFAHLVRLLELNTADPEQVDRELHYLAKSPK